MFKIKTLNPANRKSKMISYIHKKGFSERDVANCLGLSYPYLNIKLNSGLNKHDEKTIKVLIDKLAKKRKENK